MIVCYDCFSQDNRATEYTRFAEGATTSPTYETIYCPECGSVNFIEIPNDDDESIVINLLKAVYDHVTGKRTIKITRIVHSKSITVIPHKAHFWENVESFVKSLDLFPEEKEFYESLPKPKLEKPTVLGKEVLFCANCGSFRIYTIQAPIIENNLGTKILTDNTFHEIFCGECGSYHIIKAIIPTRLLEHIKELKSNKNKLQEILTHFRAGSIPLYIVYYGKEAKSEILLDPATVLPFESKGDNE